MLLTPHRNEIIGRGVFAYIDGEVARAYPFVKFFMIECATRVFGCALIRNITIHRRVRRNDDVAIISLRDCQALEAFEALEVLEALDAFEALEAFVVFEAFEALEALEAFEAFEALEALDAFEAWNIAHVSLP